MRDDDLDNIEAAALGNTGVGVFAHPKDTLLLVAEIRRLREHLFVLKADRDQLRKRLNFLVETACPECLKRERKQDRK